MTRIRIAGLLEESIVDGPGMRCVVFTQGCPHQCMGCHNPGTWDESGGRWVEIDQVESMLSANPLLQGLTLSGGEPTLQPAACAELARRAQRAGLDVWCYTGFTHEHLLRRCRTEPDLVELLGWVDVLVDGPYVQSRRSLELAWRGSTNQRIIQLGAPLAHRTG